MARRTQHHPRSVGWIVAAVIGALGLAFGALVFTNARTTGEALADATALHVADMTLAGQDLAMKSIGQLVLLAQDQERDIAVSSDVETAAMDVAFTLADVQERFADVDADTAASIEQSFDAWHVAAGEVASLASAGNAAGAVEALTTKLAPAAEALTARLVAERNLRSAAVDETRGGIGVVARFAGFLTVFLIPLGAIGAYRLVARRQLDVAEAHLEARIESEKSVAHAKDEFIARIAKELRTPLASIFDHSEGLLNRGSVDTEPGGDVGLDDESAQLARKVEDLLVAARCDAPLHLAEDLVAMDETIEAVVAPFTRLGHSIGGNCGSGSVVADGSRVRQILRNLIDNAVQHGGREVRVYGTPAGSNYVVAVEDGGTGISDDVADRVFARIVRQGEPPVAAGSKGLGLVVARQLAVAMGGSLEYERVAGRTALVLSLPLHQVAPSDVDDSAPLIAVEQ